MISIEEIIAAFGLVRLLKLEKFIRKTIEAKLAAKLATGNSEYTSAERPTRVL
jgi:hypothetical protein